MHLLRTLLHSLISLPHLRAASVLSIPLFPLISVQCLESDVISCHVHRFDVPPDCVFTGNELLDKCIKFGLKYATTVDEDEHLTWKKTKKVLDFFRTKWNFSRETRIFKSLFQCAPCEQCISSWMQHWYMLEKSELQKLTVASNVYSTLAPLNLSNLLSRICHFVGHECGLHV